MRAGVDALRGSSSITERPVRHDQPQTIKQKNLSSADPVLRMLSRSLPQDSLLQNS